VVALAGQGVEYGGLSTVGIARERKGRHLGLLGDEDALPLLPPQGKVVTLDHKFHGITEWRQFLHLDARAPDESHLLEPMADPARGENLGHDGLGSGLEVAQGMGVNMRHDLNSISSLEYPRPETSGNPETLITT
jgi:hypothetical protein